jgi:D-alanyl-lipoteichoic acid acyltransferase DltB (MBOAT superfamily)
MIERTIGKRKKLIWLWISITINLGFLGVFKYYNFFIESLSGLLFSNEGSTHFTLLNIVLPVGISFYTFHGLSYVIDIYYERIKAEKNFVDYAVFVSFFPLLVAGPIERATHLLPQIKSVRVFNYEKGVDGIKQILWGLFKKVVIANNCAEFANKIFDHPELYGGSSHVLGAVLFSFQIYGDFSGYSDIALGSARLLGIELLKNFNFPYFSRDIAEFWRRWHISLSSWFKDYLYIPLGGSKGGMLKAVRNTFIIFLVSGFWHGANFTFIIWGLLNALFIMPSIIRKSNRNNLEIVAKGRIIPNFKEAFSILLTFALTTLAWVFFRASSVTNAIQYVKDIFQKSLFSMPTETSKSLYLFIAFFLLIEWIGRENNYAIQNLNFLRNRWSKWIFYYALAITIFMFAGKDQQFIYFQF